MLTVIDKFDFQVHSQLFPMIAAKAEVLNKNFEKDMYGGRDLEGMACQGRKPQVIY